MSHLPSSGAFGVNEQVSVRSGSCSYLPSSNREAERKALNRKAAQSAGDLGKEDKLEDNIQYRYYVKPGHRPVFRATFPYQLHGGPTLSPTHLWSALELKDLIIGGTYMACSVSRRTLRVGINLSYGYCPSRTSLLWIPLWPASPPSPLPQPTAGHSLRLGSAAVPCSIKTCTIEASSPRRLEALTFRSCACQNRFSSGVSSKNSCVSSWMK